MIAGLPAKSRAILRMAHAHAQKAPLVPLVNSSIVLGLILGATSVAMAASVTEMMANASVALGTLARSVRKQSDVVARWTHHM